MRICLFEHDHEDLDPLVGTRAVFDLRCGLGTLGEKLRRVARASSWAAWVRPEIVDLVRQSNPGVPVNDASSRPTLWLNARWLPSAGTCLPPAPGVGVVGDEVAWVSVPPRSRSLDDLFAEVGTLPSQPAGGTMIRYPWDLVDHNGTEIERDVRESPPLPMSRLSHVAMVGPNDRVFVDPTARIDPMVVLDSSPGPIVIGPNAVVSAFSRIEGPCVVGAGTQIMGAKIRGGVTLGPQCRIGGEVEASIVHGYANKYHEGFLGHSYLGEWVNLGAGTHTSDLRNDYGDVDVTIAGRRVATGRSKVGCFLGDHTKTGLGSLINTGSNIGAFCNVLPAGRFAPKYMPAFTSWWNGQIRLGFPMTQLLITARKVMQRRGQSLTDAHIRLYDHLWEKTDRDRCRALDEAEVKLRRRSA